MVYNVSAYAKCEAEPSIWAEQSEMACLPQAGGAISALWIGGLDTAGHPCYIVDNAGSLYTMGLQVTQKDSLKKGFFCFILDAVV